MFGLRWIRMKQWAQDVWREKPGIAELWMMTLMAAKAIINPIPKVLYIKRLRFCEEKCPIFNHKTKACRNGERGCGCYVPYKALARVKCWLEEQDPLQGWGSITENNVTVFSPIVNNN